jgi:hypothetical protein
VRNTKTVKANIVIFATSNGTGRLSKPLLSRFTVYEIPEYTYEEFEGIALRIIKKLHPNAVIQIASSVWKAGSRDIRDVLKIAKLCNPADTEEDIIRFPYTRNTADLVLTTIDNVRVLHVYISSGSISGNN